MIAVGRLVALVVGALLSLTIGARASELLEQVRVLNRLQGAMVRGGPTARAEIPAQVRHIEQVLAALPRESWKERSNANASAILLLCGGSPQSIRKIADAHLFDEKDSLLISAALAFAEGRRQEALKSFASIDLKASPTTLGAHMALVQGGLLIGADNARARELFDYARLLMPNSLVEEAALRRELAIVDPVQEIHKFLVLCRRYWSQYSKSPFASKFWDQMRVAAPQIGVGGDDMHFAEFKALLENAAPSIRFEAHMMIARQAVLRGRLTLAREATKYASALAETQSARARIALYSAALSGLSGESEAAATELQKIDQRQLPASDIELRNVVTAVIEKMQIADAATLAPAKSASEIQRAEASESAAERAARQALDNSASLLQRASRR